MPEYQRLCEESKASRRTIADALEVLRQAADFADDDRAEIRIGALHLPSDHIVGLVDIVFDAPHRDKTFIVSLPTSARCRAICDAWPRRRELETSKLDGAVVDAEANVHVSGGKLRAVEVIPFPLPYEPTELDWRIVRLTIAIIAAEDRCYRSLRDGMPLELRHMVPDLRFLDCSTLSGLDLPALKYIRSWITEKDHTLRKLSEQKVADSLRKFGMRIPKPRPGSD
jgi:hypothetical protein